MPTYLDFAGSSGSGQPRSLPNGVSMTAVCNPCGWGTSGSCEIRAICAFMFCRVFAMMLSNISRLGPSGTTLAFTATAGVLPSLPGRWKMISSSSVVVAAGRELGSASRRVGCLSDATLFSNSTRTSTKPGICKASPGVLLDFTAVFIAPS